MNEVRKSVRFSHRSVMVLWFALLALSLTPGSAQDYEDALAELQVLLEPDVLPSVERWMTAELDAIVVETRLLLRGVEGLEISGSVPDSFVLPLHATVRGLPTPVTTVSETVNFFVNGTTPRIVQYDTDRVAGAIADSLTLLCGPCMLDSLTYIPISVRPQADSFSTQFGMVLSMSDGTPLRYVVQTSHPHDGVLELRAPSSWLVFGGAPRRLRLDLDDETFVPLPALRRLLDEVGDQSLVQAKDYLRASSVQGQASLPFFGLGLHTNVAALLGTGALAGALLLLLAHLFFLRPAMAEEEADLVPLVILSSSWPARVVTVATLTLAPSLATALLVGRVWSLETATVRALAVLTSFVVLGVSVHVSSVLQHLRMCVNQARRCPVHPRGWNRDQTGLMLLGSGAWIAVTWLANLVF